MVCIIIHLVKNYYYPPTPHEGFTNGNKESIVSLADPPQDNTTQNTTERMHGYTDVHYQPDSYEFTPTSTITTKNLPDNIVEEKQVENIESNNGYQYENNNESIYDDDDDDDDDDESDSDSDSDSEDENGLNGIDPMNTIHFEYGQQNVSNTIMNRLNNNTIDLDTSGYFDENDDENNQTIAQQSIQLNDSMLENETVESSEPTTMITNTPETITNDIVSSCAKANANTPILPYGYTYFPHTTWDVPQKRPPVCTPKAQPTVVPIYTGGVPENALEIQSSMNHDLQPTTYTSTNNIPENNMTSNSFYNGHTSVVVSE